MRKNLAKLSAIVLLVAACSSSSTGTVDLTPYAGTYKLLTANGVVAPALGVGSGSEVLTADGTYTWTQQTSATATISQVGRYSVSGNRIAFFTKSWSGGEYGFQFAGTIDPASLTVNFSPTSVATYGK